MSTTQTHPVKITRVIDTVSNLQADIKYGVIDAGLNSTYITYPSTTSSDSTMNFSILPPSRETILDRHVYIKTSIFLTVNSSIASPGPNLASYLFNPIYTKSYIALRQCPLQSVTSSVALTLGNSSFQMNPWQLVNPFLWLNRWEMDDATSLSTSPMQPDQYYDYSLADLSIRSPFIHYFSSDPYNNSRGSYPYTLVGTNTNQVANVRFDICEPLLITPLLRPQDQSVGLYGLPNVQVNLTLSDLSRLFSMSPTMFADPLLGVVTTSVSLTNNGTSQPSMLVRYITPKLIERFPQFIRTGFNDIISVPTAFSAFASSSAGEEQVITSTNQQLSAVPRLFVVYARIADSQRTSQTADCYYRIKKASVTFNNRSGLLASASEEQLYQISRKHGLKSSWPQWINWTGSVFAFDITDLGVGENDIAPGLLGQFNFQIQVTLGNNLQTTVANQLFVAVVTDGILTYDRETGNHLKEIGVINRTDVLNSLQLEGHDMDVMRTLEGGSFFGGLKSAFDKGKAFFEKSKPTLGKIADIAQSVLPQYAVPIQTVRDLAGFALKKKKQKKKKGGQLSNMSRLIESSDSE